MGQVSKDIIIENKAQCTHCNDVVESTHRHDYRACSCRKIAVDGGKDYLRRVFDSPSDFIELSLYETVLVDE